MLIGYKRGQGSIILRVKILDSSVATGAGKTGLTSSSAGLRISTIADNEASATAYAQASSNIESITTLGTYAAPTSGKCRFKEVDAVNHPGVYELQIADARFAVSNAKSLLVSISGASGAAETDVVIPLRDLDPYDAAAAGLSRLDAAVGSRLASAGYTAPDNSGISAIQAKTDNLPVSPAATGDIPSAAAIRAELDATSSRLAHLDADITSRAPAGTALSTDDWTGARAARLDHLDADVSSRLASAGYTPPDNSGIAAIQAKTDNLPADPASAAQVASRAAPGEAMTLTSGERSALVAVLFDFAVEGSEKFLELLRLLRAALLGPSEGFPEGPVHFRDRANTKPRITATVDAEGNRLTVTTDPT